ncbi:MAG: Hsp20/alpha crystallin family protein [bacterium]
MSLIKWSPVFESLNDMEKVFGEYSPSQGRSENSFMPAIDMYEDSKNVIIETELIGINPENVEVSINNNLVTIKGESEKKSEVEDKNYYRKEIKRGAFYRTIQLPGSVLTDSAVASVDKGVLKISIPKKNETNAKILKIKVNNE